MTADERIHAIHQAQTVEQLHEAMRGYRAEAVEAYPRLGGCYPMQRCLETGVYTHAVVDLSDFEKTTNEAYPEAKRVLTAAAEKHTQLGGHVPSDLSHKG
ncbi:hypothetical protein [Cupriavidus necator]|uniref:hypothetical protein n=1 Tax=Cupriavidus necator TaxID=106590 RepID=UPI000A41E5B2|nr:hypothetical protein [Cupriavidus necator]